MDTAGVIHKEDKVKESELRGKVHSAVYHQCQQRGYATPVDVLVDIGVLPKQKYEDWRFGKVRYLEAACTCNLKKLSFIMKQIRSYAKKTNLNLSFCKRYKRNRIGDSTKIALPYGTDGAAVPVQKFHVVQKLYAAMTDGKMEYVLYGAENQVEIHYAMPVKNNLYDALEYAGQVEEAAKSHRKEMKRKKEEGEASAEESGKTPSAGEFLSGFWAEDRLIPSITVTIFFGSEEWNGPLSLFEMMDVSDPDVFACMDNYHVRLIAPAQMPDEEIMKFQSSLREVMLFIKYSKDKENLSRALAANEKRFREVERRAADVIEAITNIRQKSGVSVIVWSCACL